MADSRGSISLTDLLIRLLNDHVPKEVAYQEALYQHTKGSKFYDEKLEGDPPIWERTAWDTAVRWLARKSAFFHGMAPAASIDEDPIDTYEKLLRKYLTDVKRGGPTQSNPVAGELLEFERQGAAAELCKTLGADLPADVQKQWAAAEAARVQKQKPKQRGRKKATYETQQREAQLAADWKQAREAGTYKADFAKQEGMTLKDLDALLGRVYKRTIRSRTNSFGQRRVIVREKNF